MSEHLIPRKSPREIHKHRGVIQVIEAGPDGTPLEITLYPIPLEALSFVELKHIVGIDHDDLLGATSDAQYHIMNAWYRYNYRPITPQDQIDRSKMSSWGPREQLSHQFSARRIGTIYRASELLIGELQTEASIWVPKSTDPLDARRQSALDALDGLEVAIKRVQFDTPGPGHNQPREPLDDSPATLDDGCREALVAIEDSRREVRADRPNFEVLRRSAQAFIKLARIAGDIVGRAAHATWPAVKTVARGAASIVGADTYENGSDAAIAHVAALWHTGVNAAMALQALIGGL